MTRFIRYVERRAGSGAGGAGSVEPWVLDVAAVRHLDRLEFTAPITVFTGDNGVGKSTLLTGIARSYGFPVDGGVYHPPAGPLDPLSPLLHVVERREAKRGYFLRGDAHFEAGRKMGSAGPSAHHLHAMSHGESVMMLVEHFPPEGIYILDEPESGLSAVRQMALLVLLHDLAAAGAQIIMVTHSPILLGIPGAELIEIGEDGYSRGLGVEETTAFRAMRDYLADPEGIAQYMLEVTRGSSSDLE